MSLTSLTFQALKHLNWLHYLEDYPVGFVSSWVTPIYEPGHLVGEQLDP